MAARTSSAANHIADCYCIPLCGTVTNESKLFRLTHDLVDEGARLLRRMRGVAVEDVSSPWATYLDAIYDGHAPRPYNLSRLSTFYVNSPAWRRKYPGVPNPFKDCWHLQGKQPQCAPTECDQWLQYLRAQPTEDRMDELFVYSWPMIRGGDHNSFDVRLVQLYSKNDVSFGREPALPNNSWVEVIRSSNRPYFEEGVVPPNCHDWEPPPRNHYHLGEPLPACWERLASSGGGRFPQGCWARPAPGSGVWLNTGFTEYHQQLPPDLLQRTLDASRRGVDTLQVTFGDPFFGAHAPLMLVTGDGCVGRPQSQPLRACLPERMLRGGWHDRPCGCDENAHYTDLNSVNLHGLETQVPEQQPPPVNPDKPFLTAGAINCRAQPFVSPLEHLHCYVLRYTDLLQSFCRGELAACPWNTLLAHWEQAGRAEGRKLECDHKTPTPSAGLAANGTSRHHTSTKRP